MTNYVATLIDLVPDARLSYTGLVVDYDDIEWQDERPQPSRAQCDARWPSLEVEVINAAAKMSRVESYRSESDPLFFGWQRDENTKQDWLDKVNEIRERYPYVD